MESISFKLLRVLGWRPFQPLRRPRSNGVRWPLDTAGMQRRHGLGYIPFTATAAPPHGAPSPIAGFGPYWHSSLWLGGGMLGLPQAPLPSSILPNSPLPCPYNLLYCYNLMAEAEERREH